MAVFVIGAAASAAMAVGAYGISRIDKIATSRKTVSAGSYADAEGQGTGYIYDSSEQARERDEYALKHSSYEANIASPGWDDQTWSWDCAASGSCTGVPGGAPRGKAPKYGEHIDKPVGYMGDALEEMTWGTGRDASTELELAPERTKTYTSHPLDYGGQLTPEEIPYGAQEATDAQFWGPLSKAECDAERYSRMPSYVDNRETEFDGKEINRPLDEFGWQEFSGDQEFSQEGAKDVDYSGGQSSARGADVRLMQRNLYGSFATSKSAERPKYLPPIPTRASGGGQPGLEPDVTFGARLSKVFSAFLGERNGGVKAGAEFAETTLEKSRMMDYTPRLGNGRAPGGAQPSGPQVNPVRGGRMSLRDDTLQLPAGQAKPRIAASSSLDLNPYDGHHYTSRETNLSWEDNTGGKSRSGKNGYLLLGDPQLEYRQRKQPDDLQAYQAPRSGARGSIYAGEESHGIMFPNVKSSGETERTLGKGGRNTLGRPGMISLRSNLVNGMRGCDYDDSPETYEGLINLRTPRAVAVVGGRSKEALDDLFDVEHS